MQLLARFEMNGNREMWTDYCYLNQWLIGETLFIRKRGRLLMVVPGIGSTIWHLARDGGAGKTDMSKLTMSNRFEALQQLIEEEKLPVDDE